jgi:hypothetical protein
MGSELRTFHVDCPQCHRDVKIRGEVHGRLTIEAGRPAALRLAVKAAPIQHRCKEPDPALIALPGMDDEAELLGQLEAGQLEAGQLEAGQLEAEQLEAGDEAGQLEAPG